MRNPLEKGIGNKVFPRCWFVNRFNLRRRAFQAPLDRFRSNFLLDHVNFPLSPIGICHVEFALSSVAAGCALLVLQHISSTHESLANFLDSFSRRNLKASMAEHASYRSRWMLRKRENNRWVLQLELRVIVEALRRFQSKQDAVKRHGTL